MFPPSLTPTLFLHLADLKANPKLANQLAILENSAFTRSHAKDPQKWNVPSHRFPTTQHLLDLVGDSGVMAIILDEVRNDELDDALLVHAPSHDGDGATKGKLVACSAVIPWSGGWEKEGAGTETGWEVKAVAVDEDEMYLGKGIAIKLLADIEKYLIDKERVVTKGISRYAQENAALDVDRGILNLWLLVAEDLNGEYWRRRGYSEVRRKTCSWIWGCHTSFDMLTMRKQVLFNIE
ncbi:hypothetical protein CC80DRAFT_480754 [Byssothecium circinans]|uniref:N-acetyltransferase domain-containing protein n=1 Tax=Byssothecium circinans TaxID=147558 RepID=A0A6A5TRI6_9PLEO|nr:hypothetical protein CC80DRAFT_480754 [Byssothecium circinans]